MESTGNAFVESQKKKKRRKRIRSLIILGVVVILLIAGCVILFKTLNAKSASTSVLTYNAERVREGEISSTISGSGTLSATETTSFTSAAAATVENVYFAPGDSVCAGDTILTLSSDELDEQIDALTEELDDVQTELSGATQTRTNLNVTAAKKGVIKDVRAAEGDVAEDLEYLCLISTDGKMKLVIDAPESLTKYDAVLISVGGADRIDGAVTELENGKATIVFEDDGYAVGAAAEAYDANGTPLGGGAVGINEHVSIKGYSGRIASVKYGVENQSVSKGAVLFVLESGAPASNYLTLKAEESDLLAQIEELEEQRTIQAEFDGILASLSVEAGDEISAGASLCTLSGSAGYTMSLSIDELDISLVALGQTATVTLDALDGQFSGEVTNISYAGSGSYVTSYSVTITTEPIEGALPGMSASVEIVTETSGNSLIVSVGALQYEGEQAFVYLCGDDVSLGMVMSEEALDLDGLTKVYVTTGMSDGSYIAVTADGLSSEDLIWAPSLNTTAEYSDDEETTVSFGGMGGQSGGGQMPSGNMGGGQMPSGNMGGQSGGFPGGN